VSAVALLFPGGVCLIDQDHIWRSLATWAHGSDERCVKMRCIGGEWQTELLTTEATHKGSSRLSMADSVAQALQAATSQREAT
jgi:hypothetical protein